MLYKKTLYTESENKIMLALKRYLTLTRPIGLPPHTPVAQKIADLR